MSNLRRGSECAKAFPADIFGVGTEGFCFSLVSISLFHPRALLGYHRAILLDQLPGCSDSRPLVFLAPLDELFDLSPHLLLKGDLAYLLRYVLKRFRFNYDRGFRHLNPSMLTGRVHSRGHRKPISPHSYEEASHARHAHRSRYAHLAGSAGRDPGASGLNAKFSSRWSDPLQPSFFRTGLPLADPTVRALNRNGPPCTRHRRDFRLETVVKNLYVSPVHLDQTRRGLTIPFNGGSFLCRDSDAIAIGSSIDGHKSEKWGCRILMTD